MINMTIQALTAVMKSIIIIIIMVEDLWEEYIMEAHGIGDHGSIVEEVEAEWEFQVEGAVAQVAEVVAQVAEVVAQVAEAVAQVAEVVAQVAEVVAQVAVEEDLDDFLNILWM
tara:strand:- start:96 stop:434 length:339 start_codon:yes stop_codon:yes gene_type:complete